MERIIPYYVQTAMTTASRKLLGSRKRTATLRPTTISAVGIARDVGMLSRYTLRLPMICTEDKGDAHAFKIPFLIMATQLLVRF